MMHGIRKIDELMAADRQLGEDFGFLKRFMES